MNAILCFGDSIIFGRGETPPKGWVGRLKEWWESKDQYNVVYNLGIPGDTSEGLLKRISIELDERVKYLRPGDRFQVIIGIGTNDLSFDGKNVISKERFKENISKIMTIVSVKVDCFYFLEIPPVNEAFTTNWENAKYTNQDILEYNEILREITQSNFVGLDFSNWNLKLSDGLHPNTEGYDEMFQQINRLFDS